MTTKNIQLKDLSGNELLPKTSGALVFNGTGASAYNLSTVEEGAEVNIIETVKVNGTALTPDANRAVDITIASQAEYTIAKKETAETGYSASYYLTKDGTKVGEYINIPKDMVVESGTVETCTVADVPVEGYKVGDKYIDLVIANASSSHLYILVSDLIDIYTAGNGIDITSNVVSVTLTGYAKASTITDVSASDNLVTALGKLEAKADEKVVANAAITGATKTKITYDAKGLVTAGADLAESDIPSLHLTKISDVTATAAEVNVLDGITATTAELNILDGVTADASEINILDGATVTTTELNYLDGVTSSVQDQLDDKVAKNTAITGATKCKITYDAKGLVTAGADLELTDLPAITTEKVSACTGYSKGSSSAAIAATDTLNAALSKLENQIDTKQATITGAATSIVSNDLTASKFLVSDTNGKVAASSIASDAALVVWEEITE